MMMIIIFAIIAYFVYDYYKKRELQLMKVTNVISPIAELEMKYAKGEISEEEFTRKVQILKMYNK